MSKVKRIYVEKRPGFDVEAGHILSDLNENLGMNIKSLRFANRYDVSGLDDDQMEMAVRSVFSEPNQDNVYYESWNLPEEWHVFAMEYLPGQFDQRADSAAQCVQLLTQGERPLVASSKVIAMTGELTDEDVRKVQDYLINPVESRLAGFEKPDSLEMTSPVPDDIPEVAGFIDMTREQIADYHRSMGFAMSVDDLEFCRDYFRESEKRNPRVTELRVIDTYWSDHCRHTTFLSRLEDISIEKSNINKAAEKALEQYYAARREVYGDRDKDVSLMDMATIGGKLLHKRGFVEDLDISEEINACSIEAEIEVDGKKQTYLIQFKNETHNHPTEIEPFGGAATCLGGAIRDPLSGRSYVYQAMRVTGAGDPTVPFKDTLPDKLSQRKICTGAAAGYSSYGNQIGLATGQVYEIYDPGYVAKRMEIGAVIGASPKNNVVRGVPSEGDVIVLLGGRTGRDGCGGATGSSKAHTSESLTTCGAEVQKGNAPTERKLQRLFRNGEVARMIKRCNDFGAGGVSVAIGELADGLTVDLDKVPKKYDGLDGTELAISESQERMAVVLEQNDVDAFIAAAVEENLEATPVAVVTREPVLTMLWRGKPIVSIKREFLNTNGVTQTARAKIVAPDENKYYRNQLPEEVIGKDIASAFKANLKRLSVCCQKGLSERFDSSIGAATVLMPFAGKNQLTPEEAMVAKIPVDGFTDDATAMSYGFMPKLSRWSPFCGAAFAVVESLSKIAAVGADPLKARLTFQEYFERLHDVPERWGKPTAALLGALSAQIGMGTPSIGGKDSMSGSFNELDVPPTLVSFAVSMTKASHTISAAFTKAGKKAVLFPIPLDPDGIMPDYDKLRELYREVHSAVLSGRIEAASVVSEGGCAAAVMRMCAGNSIGFEFASADEKLLFAPINGSIIAVTDDTDGFKAENILLGETTEEAVIRVGGETLPLDEIVKIWLSPTESVFPNYAKPGKDYNIEIKPYSKRGNLSPAIKTAKPKVFIPVFPGTNCEYDTKKAFERAGAETEILIVNNLSAAGIEQTIEKMVKGIGSSQIIMIPGGFSGGDEPDGSGKFIATTFRNERVKNAVMELLNNRDGLMLGICNGFQALIKLGLVPFGEIRDIQPGYPTLTFNNIGRHVSRMAFTKVSSVKSPWLSGVELGDVHAVPVSHGEGRFVADEQTVARLAANGQIAFRYCDSEGNITPDITTNPNGSVCSIEGITSPDGRILGKMGHSERMDRDCYKNVPCEKDQQIFASGVNYFK